MLLSSCKADYEPLEAREEGVSLAAIPHRTCGSPQGAEDQIAEKLLPGLDVREHRKC